MAARSGWDAAWSGAGWGWGSWGRRATGGGAWGSWSGGESETAAAVAAAPQAPAAQQEHELIEFRIKGTACKWCLPLEQYLENITEKFSLRYVATRPYAVLVPLQQADDFWHHMKRKLQREPGRSRLFRRR